MFLFFAVIFVPLGGAMFFAYTNTNDVVIEYSLCESLANSDYFTEIPDNMYEYNFKTNITIKPQWKLVTNSSIDDPVENKVCQLQFQIPDDLGGPVFFFYQLDRFYANHRRYVKSYSEDQINGMAASVDDVKNTVGQNCQPMSTDDATGKIIYPCGLIANSLYNDTYTSPVAINGTSNDFSMSKDGIAWSTDKNRFTKTKYNSSQIVPPPNWFKKFPNGYNDTNIPDVSTWQDFQNWMHPAGLSKFSVLYYRQDKQLMPSGVYQVDVGLHWPVLQFNGTKAIYLSSRSVIGGRNPFLGISWIVVGGLCFILGFAFLVIHVVSPRKMGDTSLLSWNKEKEE